ncbi:SCO3374 family protein [Streptomyces sp. NPDC051776]|uniref:SCO3374 family protein n=1 Tax=Streptomyces sp. NPDC051776 TaxID=3155414 RepID=UPI00342EDD09
MATAFPRPRRETCDVRLWYERVLGWPVTGGQPAGRPVNLLTGVRFDALELPADAGAAVLRRVPRTGPVALDGDRMRFLIAAGGAEQLPELLDWLEWGGVALDLTALGPGDRMRAPQPGGSAPPRGDSAPPPGESACRPGGSWEAACTGPQPVWLRPPEPGCEIEPTLPVATLGGSAQGHEADGERAPDLVRLVGAAATQVHRARLLNASRAQALAFSYASRISAGTRPRSLTL